MLEVLVKSQLHQGVGMAPRSGRDFLVCYYCPSEATEVVTVHKGAEVLRRWVCEYHADHLPATRRRRWLRAVHVPR
jgi:hypothetical protein